MDTEGAPRRRSDPHQAILDAAREAFTARGYVGMNLDEVTSGARVSKQTVYRLFGNKEGLFSAVIRSRTDSLDRTFSESAARFGEADDVEVGLTELARGFLRLLMTPEALRLRRLVIAEADRFPEICRRYQDRGIQRVQDELARALARLVERGLLSLDDPAVAATHLCWTMSAEPVNTAMFCGTDTPFSDAELEHHAVAATRFFLAAYAPRPERPPSEVLAWRP